MVLPEKGPKEPYENTKLETYVVAGVAGLFIIIVLIIIICHHWKKARTSQKPPHASPEKEHDIEDAAEPQQDDYLRTVPVWIGPEVPQVIPPIWPVPPPRRIIIFDY